MTAMKVMIPLVSTVLFYVCAEATMSDKLHGIVAVSVLVFIVAFFVAKMFTEVSSSATAFPRKPARLFNPLPPSSVTHALR